MLARRGGHRLRPVIIDTLLALVDVEGRSIQIIDLLLLLAWPQ